MTVDRWNPKRVTIETPKPARIVMVDAPAGVVEPRGKTWGIRVRGDTEGRVIHAYRCPVHGNVDVEVYRKHVPEVVPCALESWSISGFDDEYADLGAAEQACRDKGIGLDEVRFETQRCAADCTWSGSSSIGIGHAAGEVES